MYSLKHAGGWLDRQDLPRHHILDLHSLAPVIR
jgi:hypothetical protein